MTKDKILCCKTQLIVLFNISIISLIGCSSTNQNNSNMPKPPQNFNQSPQKTSNPPSINKNIGNPSQAKSESYVPFIRTEETRATGGMVIQIKVNNHGDLPSYYIYPEQHQNQTFNVNNLQKNVITPTWQYSW